MPRGLHAAAAWAAVLVCAAALLAASGYTSRDPDSTAYATIAARLAREPISTWLVPQWWGAWNYEGPFREHPVGIFVLPALLARAGVPGEQAAYVVGALASALAAVLIGTVAAPLVRPGEVAAVRFAALLLPVAFVYRIRANQEYPLLVLLLVALLATERARRTPAWIAAMVAAAVSMFLVKGIFVIFMPIVCSLWLWLVPRRSPGGDGPVWVGLASSVLAVGAAVVVYEWAYHATAGDSFLEYYIATRLGSNTGLDQAGVPRVLDRIVNVGWYLARLAWFAMPGSLILGVVAFRRRLRPLHPALAFVLATAGAYVLLMSTGANRAERFIFPAYFAVGAAGAVVAARRWDTVARLARWAERQGPLALPMTWFALFLLTFLTAGGLPRLQF